MFRWIFIYLLLFTFSFSNTVYKNNLTNKTLNSASELDYPPFSIVSKDGKAGGFSVELLTNAIEVMGGNVTFYVDEWDKIKSELKDGKIDVLPVVGRTEEREKHFDFTTPYLVMHGAIFSRKDDKIIINEKELKDKDILVMKGDNAQEYVTREQLGKNIIEVSSYEEAFKELSEGRYDVVIVQKLVGLQLIKRLNLTNIQVSAFVLENFRQDFSFAVKDGNKELLALLNEGLAIIKADGTYEKLYQKWFHSLDDNLGVDKRIVYFFIGLSFLFAMALLVFNMWNRILRKKVTETTKDLKELNDSLSFRVESALKNLKEKDELMIAQSRAAAMGDMISMIAHQWRQPLSTISMSSNSIMMDIELDTLEKENTKNTLSEIQNEIQYLSKTIDDFRNFFKPDKKKEKVFILDVVNDSLQLMNKGLENNSINHKVICEHNSEVVLFSRELLQVLINIIKNAQEILLEKSIDDRQLEITIHEKENFIYIDIFNNGKKIKEENLTKIFDPYFSTKKELDGTGLGLYMSKIIIDKHIKGKIFVENKKEGVCFSIAIPKNLK